MQPKIMHGRLITGRYLIMAFVRLCAVWGESNTCRSCILVYVQDTEHTDSDMHIVIYIYLYFLIFLVSSYLSRSVLEEDEVFSVARLLGDLVAYRAAGTGHLELMAGFVWTCEVSYCEWLNCLYLTFSSYACIHFVILCLQCSHCESII